MQLVYTCLSSSILKRSLSTLTNPSTLERKVKKNTWFHPPFLSFFVEPPPPQKNTHTPRAFGLWFKFLGYTINITPLIGNRYYDRAPITWRLYILHWIELNFRMSTMLAFAICEKADHGPNKLLHLNFKHSSIEMDLDTAFQCVVQSCFAITTILNIVFSVYIWRLFLMTLLKKKFISIVIPICFYWNKVWYILHLLVFGRKHCHGWLRIRW